MIEITTLDNGIRVVSDKMQDVDTVSMGIWVGVGSSFEEEHLNGISHMLEHMAFKGTLTRTALQIAEEIENVGGIINAYTSRDVTAYYVKVLKEDAPMALALLADIFQNSTMDGKELAKEKGVIIQEIGQTYDTPDDAVFEYYQKTAYPNQAFGRSILGTVEHVNRIGTDDLLAYMHKEYTNKRTIVSASGNVNHDWLVSEVQNLFSKMKQNDGTPADIPVYSSGEFRMKKDIEQVNIVVGAPALTHTHPLYYAQSIFSTILGGGMSSRLFQEIREKRGLVYSIYSFAYVYRNGGTFGVFAGTGEKEASELLPVVCDEVMGFAGSVREEEINRAKATLKAHLLMKNESTSARCEANARMLDIYGRIPTKEEQIRLIEDVDATKLQQVSKALLEQTPTLACIGPIDYVMDYEAFKKRIDF